MLRKCVIALLFSLFIGELCGYAQTVQKDARPFTLGVKTNLLMDAVLIPNVGVEVPLGSRWSVGLDWQYAWWQKKAMAFCWQTYGGYFTVRRYVGKDKGLLTGHHVGVYGQLLTYDVDFGSRGAQSARWNYGGGVEYGYSMPLREHLHVDFSIGVGYLGGLFKEYNPVDDHFVWQATKQLNWIGPTKAEVSLVWTLGLGNNRNKNQ